MRHHREEERGADQHRPAADLVGHHAEDQRADQHAEVGGGEHRAELRARRCPSRATMAGADVAHRLDVEAVHDQADHAEDEDADLQRADRAVLEQLADVDRAGRRPVSSRLLEMRDGSRLHGAISDFANADPRSILACRP